MKRHTVKAAGLAAVLVLAGAACSDEDGDGATTDEEVDDLDERAEDVASELDEEIDQGADEATE